MQKIYLHIHTHIHLYIYIDSIYSIHNSLINLRFIIKIKTSILLFNLVFLHTSKHRQNRERKQLLKIDVITIAILCQSSI